MHYKHGHARKGQVTRIFGIWRGMLKRCNPAANRLAIKSYAARGITVCDEWREFQPFLDWAMENGYADHLSIERRDNNGPYSPANCCWATRKEQCRNRRNTRWIEVNGVRKSLAAWLEQTGVSRAAFHGREERGWSIPRALGLIDETPVV